MLERKEIIRIIQNELILVGGKLNSLKNFTFPKDSKITVSIKDRLIDLEYSETDFLQKDCDLALSFNDLPYECMISNEILQFQIKSKLSLSLKKQQEKLNYDQLNLNNILSEEQKECYLTSSKITLIIERSDTEVKASFESVCS